jgi:hypothetical protein
VISGAVLVKVGADQENDVVVAFSHQTESRAPHCQIESATSAQPAATPDEIPDAATPAVAMDTAASPEPAATPVGLPGLNLQIEATAANNELAEYGMPYPLRLFTVNLPPAGQPTGDLGAQECRLGFILLYVLTGQVEFTHHAGGANADLGDSGAVTYVKSGNPSETSLAVGASVVLEPGDSVFLERAVFSFRNVGPDDAQLLGSAATPQWLPCAGGGCS